MTKRATYDEMAVAIRVCNGEVSQAAEMIGYTPGTMKSYILRDPRLRLIRDQARLKRLCDQAATYTPPLPASSTRASTLESRRDEITDMLKRCMSQTQIAKHFNMSRERVRQIVNTLGLHDLYLSKRVEKATQAAFGRWIRRGHHRYLKEGADALTTLGHTVETTFRTRDRNWRIGFKIDGKYTLRCCMPKKLAATSPGAHVLYYHLNLSLPKTVYYVVMPEQRAVCFPDDIPPSGSIYLRPNGEQKQWERGGGPTYQWMSRDELTEGEDHAEAR